MLVIKETKLMMEHFSFTDHHSNQGEFYLNPKTEIQTGKIRDNLYFTSIEVSISNTPDTPFPLDINVKMRIEIELDSLMEQPIEEIDELLKGEGVLLLYPYVRSSVANICSLAMIPPIHLPILNLQDI